MPEAAIPRIEQLAAGNLAEVRPLLLDLLAEDQRHYGVAGGDRSGIEGLVGDVRATFAGENLVLGVREEERLVAFCWCVFYDPGTGYEAEVAEVYVQPDHRGRGLATALVRAAVDLFRERDVTFAAVWTHPANAAAVRLYEAAGFAPTEQVVLTWRPDGR
ncbi:MAG TPA: GNAT family N-acetyltransferase [Candidatus Dormibacteraeota bacterium]|nr:GNAT family N-acetyltransferase [Candidatus Dormibacteraeota bacterium]